MIRYTLAIAFAFLPVGIVSADDGIVSRSSPYSVAQSSDRLEALLRDRKVVVFARIDHAAEASKAGLTMPPTQLLIFGNPKAGTPLMLAAPKIAIDLPLKVLVWQDAAGKVWLSYNTVDFLKRRHGLSDDLAKNLAAVEGIVDAAVK